MFEQSPQYEWQAHATYRRRSSIYRLLRPAVGPELGEIFRGRLGQAPGHSAPGNTGHSEMKQLFERPDKGFTNSTACNRKEHRSMNRPSTNRTTKTLLPLVCLCLYVTPVLSHHSFAMYDQTKTVVLTGVAHQFVSQANHAELHFYAIGADG